MITLLVHYNAAYATKLPYNELRSAGALARPDDSEARVFLIGNTVSDSMADQRVPRATVTATE
jgi:hypothetical protein